jgi:hypothetical protein
MNKQEIRNKLKVEHEEKMKFLAFLDDFIKDYPLPFGPMIDTAREEVTRTKAELYDLEVKLRRCK